MKKILALVLALCMVFALCACGNNNAPAESQTPAESEAPAEAPVDTSVLNVCIASEPDTIDPALNSAVDGATLVRMPTATSSSPLTALRSWSKVLPMMTALSPTPTPCATA